MSASYQQYPSAPQSGYGFTGHPDALYGASMGQAVTRFFKRYADFRGHASRSEYWWTYLAVFLASFVLSLLVSLGGVDLSGANAGSLTGFGVFGMAILVIFSLAIIVPMLAMSWRRLHDAGMSGLFYLLCFVPFLGGVIVLVLMLLPTKPHNNTHKWG